MQTRIALMFLLPFLAFSTAALVIQSVTGNGIQDEQRRRYFLVTLVKSRGYILFGSRRRRAEIPWQRQRGRRCGHVTYIDIPRHGSPLSAREKNRSVAIASNERDAHGRETALVIRTRNCRDMNWRRHFVSLHTDAFLLSQSCTENLAIWSNERRILH